MRWAGMTPLQLEEAASGHVWAADELRARADTLDRTARKLNERAKEIEGEREPVVTERSTT